MTSKGLFVKVDTLAGDAVVHGVLRRVEYSNEGLTIRGLSLVEAMAVLGVLSTPTLAVAMLDGVLPPVAAVQAAAKAPATPAPAPQASVAAVPAAPPAPSQPAPVAAPASPPPVTAADMKEADAAVDWKGPAAPAAAVEAPAAAVDAADAALSDVPADVVKAQTLRPVVGWLYEAKGVRGLPAMIAAVRALRGTNKHIDHMIRNEDAKLDARVEKTMNTQDYSLT